MANMNIGRIKVRQSGGVSETVGDNALGGAMSTVAGGLVDSQTASTTIGGVTIDDAMGNVTSADGTLKLFRTPVAQVQELIKDADLETGDTYLTDVDGVTISTPFATDNDTTMANHAASIQAESGVATAVVTDNGTSDNVIVITAQTAGTPVVLSNFSITGSTPPTVTVSITTGNASNPSLQWKDSGSGEIDAIDVATDAVYAIPSSQGGNVIVTTVNASFPGVDTTDSTVTVADIANRLFDDITKAESFNGDTEYRCVYFENSDSTDTAFGLKLWIGTDAAPDNLAIGLDPVGKNGTATTIVNESTAPAGVSFSSPTTEGTGLSFGDLAATDKYAFWIRRIISAGNQVATNNDLSKLAFSASF
jgi:hypothetical protein